MHQTLIFGQDVAKSKDARRVRESWKIRLHRAWPGSIRELNFSGLQISDILFRLSFDLGKIWILWRYFYCRWPARGPKDWKHFDADWRLISSASFHTSWDNCERNTQKWNSNNKDCKKENIETLMWLRRSCGGELREAESFATTIKQTGATC